MNLPSFIGEPKEDLERFLQQLTTLLISSCVPSRHYVTYLKQQIQKDARAYDAISQAEEQHANILHTDHDSSPSHKAYLDYFNAIKETLIQKRGKPKYEKVRELLREYYTMVQGRDKPVSEFAHHFLEIQHFLKNLIPNIHYTSDKKDTELQHTFLIKLRPHIAKHLASHDFAFKSIQSVIKIAERYDKQFGSPFPSSRTAMYADPFREDKAMLKLSSERPKSYNCGKSGHFKKDCKTANGTVDHSNLNVTKKQPKSVICILIIQDLTV